MTYRPVPKPGAAPNTTSTREPDDWRKRAACLDEDPELFHSPDGDRESSEGSQARAFREATAKAVCRACPVMLDCLQWALDTREPYGILGGLDEDERAGVHLTAATNVCGQGGGRTRHRRDGTPVCNKCLTYENTMRRASDLRRWETAGPLLARGLTDEEAAKEMGIVPESVRRARQAAMREQATQAA